MSLNCGLEHILTAVVYNKWGETELDRWLSDHDIPHQSKAEKAELAKLVESNWHSKVVSPYSDWDTTQLSAYLSERGQQAAATAGATKESLVDKVKAYWYETEEVAEDAYTNVKNWIFDTYVDLANLHFHFTNCISAGPIPN